MSLIPFSKEQLPKLDSAQLEAIHQRISVRAVAGSNILMAAERSFPHVTLDDALVEALHEQSIPPKPSSKIEASPEPDTVRQLRPEAQEAVAAVTPAILAAPDQREIMENTARAGIAAIFEKRAA